MGSIDGYVFTTHDMYFAVRVDNVEFPGFSLIIANNRRWYTVLDLSGVC